MSEKCCKGCGVAKPLAEFVLEKRNRDGYAGKCRACAYLARKAPHVWPNELARHRRLSATETGKLRERRHAARHTAKRPEQGRAKRLVRSAIESGALQRPTVCEQCGKRQPPSGGRAKIHAHHADYSKPLDVRWLCINCHAAEHRARKEG